MKHLLLLATELQEHKGGIAAVNLAILRNLKHLRRSGQIIRVLSLHDRAEEVESLAVSGIEITACQGSNLKFALFTLLFATGAERIVAGHVRLAVPLLVFPSLANLVVFGHGSEVTHRIKDSSRWLIERTGLLLANSERTANRIRIVSAAAKPVACPLGLFLPDDSSYSSDEVADLPQFCPVQGEAKPIGDQLLLLAGRMDAGERQKGHREVLAALPEVLSAHPGVQVFFAGPGDDQSNLRELAVKLDVAANVFVEGPVPRATLNLLFAHCFAFVMPSQQEGFGIVYLEAMQAAKACVGCRNDGAEEIIVDGETGYLLEDQSDIAALASCIKQLLDAPDATRKMGQHGYQRLREVFTAERFDARFQSALTASS